jgi:hypothetical protein
MLEGHANQEWSSRCYIALEEFKRRKYNCETFTQQRHSVLMKLQVVLGKGHRKSEIRYAIATLFINDDFQRRVRMLSEQLTATDTILEVNKTQKAAIWVLPQVMDIFKVDSQNTTRIRSPRKRQVKVTHTLISREEYQYDHVFPSKPNTMDEQEVVPVSAQEVYLASLWAASSCTLWMGSINSQPLMNFVRKLEDVVHIG